MAEKKLGTYICTGCGIGDALDIDALSNLATGDCGAALCKTHSCLCDEEGVALIKKDIADEGINGVVLAACSQRAKQEAFQFADATIERVSLREGVAWVLEPNNEDTQWLAEDYIRMGTAKAKETELAVPYNEGEFNKDILVVGGGVTGMTAALEAAKAGYAVTLLEKADSLGGFLAKLHKSIPSAPPYDILRDTGIGALIDQTMSNGKVDVLTSAEITKIKGAPCKFEVDIKAGGKEVHKKIGAIVLATGFNPYDPNKLGHLGYGKFKDVVTNVEFEQMAKSGKLVRPSDNKPVKNVLFLQCAGSRDPEHLPYCSTVCCSTTLKQAIYLKEKDPEAQAYILYKDIRTPGQREDFYRRVQRDGAVFIRGELKEISQPNDKLTVFANDVLLGDDVEICDLDLIVLATGLAPTTKMEGEKSEPLEGDALDTPNILKLEYRQGPELPNLRYGYPDSHFICFPYETRRTGIYAAGTVRRAMDSTAAKRDALGATLKAIQCVEMTARGEAVHPRARDQGYPEFAMQRCTQCKRCTEECPFGAINEDEKANPLPNITRCRRCGVCMGACPERIIGFKDYNVNMTASMVKAIQVPEEDEEKPCVLAFVCENDALPVLDNLALKRKKISPYIRFVPLRCLGSMNRVWVADALSKGIDGVLFLGCKHGDDYQCHFIKGSELCNYRLEATQEVLERLVLESDRLRFEDISMNDEEKLLTTIEEFMEKIEEVGPNPYKGF
ncbi:MAG: FAD-dependent oxidoreductase [Pseudomonadota bacterium]